MAQSRWLTSGGRLHGEFHAKRVQTCTLLILNPFLQQILYTVLQAGVGLLQLTERPVGAIRIHAKRRLFVVKVAPVGIYIPAQSAWAISRPIRSVEHTREICKKAFDTVIARDVESLVDEIILCFLLLVLVRVFLRVCSDDDVLSTEVDFDSQPPAGGVDFAVRLAPSHGRDLKFPTFDAGRQLAYCEPLPCRSFL